MKYSLKAELAGGEQMFQFITASDMMKTDARNIEAELSLLPITNIGESVGGKNERTIALDPSTALLKESYI